MPENTIRDENLLAKNIIKKKKNLEITVMGI